jgi:hypothetical protein
VGDIFRRGAQVLLPFANGVAHRVGSYNEKPGMKKGGGLLHRPFFFTYRFLPADPEFEMFRLRFDQA